MPVAERKKRWTADVVRERIRVGMLINRLQNHVLGRIEMSKTQIQAAGILMKKVLPDMVATESARRPLESMADHELLATLVDIRSYLAAQSGGAGTADPPTREPACPISTVQ